MRRNDGFVLVFDLTMRQSLEELVNFVEGIKRVKEDDSLYKSVPFVIIGNKSDLGDQRVVSKKEVLQYIHESLELPSETPYFESSAKLRSNCDEPFEAMVKRMWKLKVKTGGDDDTKKKVDEKHGGIFSSVSNTNEKDKDLEAFKDL